MTSLPGPLVVVPPTDQAAHRLHRILIALNGSPEAAEALRPVTRAALDAGLAVVVVHVLDPGRHHRSPTSPTTGPRPIIQEFRARNIVNGRRRDPAPRRRPARTAPRRSQAARRRHRRPRLEPDARARPRRRRAQRRRGGRSAGRVDPGPRIVSTSASKSGCVLALMLRSQLLGSDPPDSDLRAALCRSSAVRRRIRCRWASRVPRRGPRRNRGGLCNSLHGSRGRSPDPPETREVR